tara:strand:+ start:5477 stop:6469 length:993 start_codon:yes stop_codon:yes gene_type:complete
MSPDPLLSTIRISALVICMAIAARSDYETLHVKDNHWVWWSIPAVLLLLAEIHSDSNDLANMCMVMALASIFSICFVKPPDPRRFRKWTRKDLALSAVYIIGISGLILGTFENSDTNFVDLVLGDESNDTALWWSLVSALVTMVVFLLAWRFGVIQGGADVKALILVTLMFPSWAFLPDQMYQIGEDPVFGIPPSMAMFVWAGAAFLLAPPVIFIHNATKGNIESVSDLKMAWHAIRKPISDIGEGNSWILTEVKDRDSNPRVVNRILPSVKPSSGESSVFGHETDKLELLQSLGVESVWVARKHPFLVYLFLAIFPLVLLGDPIAPLII